ncbi:hypothetical protein O181_056436 [Austropuccinia psidii MF-1]|uniref:Uncharacterized protein n=1 Tax=Austropuccinia psidii MF-1 TaxID=1389203 RepID=A0A9Q3E6B6_9BASI|nr:hypothetical protein [Austropuccinia psidii MF-1]
MGCGLRSVGHGGYWRPPGPNFPGDPGVPLDQKSGPWPDSPPTWPGPMERVQHHQHPGLPKVAGEVSKIHYCYIGKKPWRQTGRHFSNLRRYLWSKKDGPFGKEFPVSEALTPDETSGYSALTGSRQRDVSKWTNVGGPLPVGGRPIYYSSEVTISRINNEGVVKKIRRIADSTPNPDAEGSDELDFEEVEVVPPSAGHPVNSSPSHPPAKRLQSHIIHNTPKNFQPTLSTIPTSIPPASPNPSHSRSASNQAVRPSPIPQPETHPWSPLNNPNLWPVPQKEGRTLSFAVFCFSSVSLPGLMAYPSYQGRSKYGQ